MGLRITIYILAFAFTATLLGLGVREWSSQLFVGKCRTTAEYIVILSIVVGMFLSVPLMGIAVGVIKRFDRKKELKVPRELNWFERGGIYAGAVVVAFLLIVCGFHKWLACLINGNGMGDWYIVSPNIVVATFLFAFIVSTAAWVIRTFDKRKEFYDSLIVRADTLFIEFTKLALSAKNSTTRAQGVLGLVQLKREHPGYKDQVDAVTSTTNLDLRRAVLHHVDLSGANLRSADLRGVDLCDANLSDANLKWTDLSESHVRDIQQGPANRTSAVSEDINEWESREEAGEDDLISTNLSRANLSRAHLIEASLESANLRGANLRGTNLSGTQLYEANLERATLVGAKLREAIRLESAKLKEAVYDKTTEFPEGFNPEEYGMIKEQSLLLRTGGWWRCLRRWLGSK